MAAAALERAAAAAAAQQQKREQRERQLSALLGRGDAADEIYFVQCGTVDLEVRGDTEGRRIMRVRRGGVLGELSFLLNQRQRLDAIAAATTDLWVLHRADFDAMRDRDPVLFSLFQTVLLKSMALQVEDSLASGATFL